MSLAYRCQVCEAEPVWTILRRGDVALTWACADHVHAAAVDMQRDWEVTELVIHLAAKAAEWAAIDQGLREIAGGRPGEGGAQPGR